MASSHSFSVVCNTHSGSASIYGVEALETVIRESFGPQLETCAFVPSQQIESALAAAFASPSSAVIVIGGDGTCRSSVEFGVRTGKPIAFVPGGTMNLLPARHWPGLDLLAALMALRAGHYQMQAIDVGQVNQAYFLIAAAFGAAPGIARVREDHRMAEGIVASVQTLFRLPNVLPHLLKPTVRLEARQVPKTHLSALAFVINNADIALGRLDVNAQQSVFECVGAYVQTPFAFVALMIRAIFDPQWRKDPSVFTAKISEGLVYAPGRFIPMTLDGEVVRLTSPAHLTLRAGALDVLVYAAPESIDRDAETTGPDISVKGQKT
jgi:diacylglycerol kinase family enzyme